MIHILLLILSVESSTALDGKRVRPSQSQLPQCVDGQPLAYPRRIDQGVELAMQFYGPFPADRELPTSLEYLARFSVSRVTVSYATPGTESAAIVSVRSRIPVRAARELDEEIAAACRPWVQTMLRLRDFALVDARQRRRAADAAERVYVRDQRRSAAIQRELVEARMDEAPRTTEVENLLRSHWGDRQEQFNLTGTTLGRVRDMNCQRRQLGTFHCTVGVTATSSRGPEYEQGTLEFKRNTDGILVGGDDVADVVIN